MSNKWFIDISDYTASDVYIDFSEIPEDARNYTYVNTYKIADLNNTTLHLSAGTSVKYMYIQVNPLYRYSFTAVIYADNIEGSHTNVAKPITYEPSIIDIADGEYEHTSKFINNNTSYQLLRVNPKLTGNVKVVITSNNDMFLDTFKVSDGLSQYKYRHIKISPDDYYGRNLMMKYSSLPNTDFYKIKDSCYNIFTAVQDYNVQYYDTYNCGVRTNDDKLYSDNFALLAPLCIKENMPDFFLVFKVDTTNYKPNNLTESEKIKYFLKYGELVKSYDMRADSNIGKYIRKIYENAAAYPGDGFVSYEDNNYNKVIGISVDRGVVTSAYESTFDEHNINNQTALNDFYTLGFERNKLVAKDIVNFEFMFNDTEERLFSLNTYFGIYVKLNSETNTFSCIGQDENTGIYQFDNTVHSFPTGTDLGPDSSYPYYIYGISTPYEFKRLNHSFIDNSINEQYMLKPYQNVLNGELTVDTVNNDKSFITIDLEKPLDPGDHIRTIDTDGHIIYEIICTNYDYGLDSDKTSHVVTNYYDTSLGVRWTFKRASMYIPYRDDISADNYESVCSDEIRQVKICFNKFDTTNLIALNDGIRLSVIANGSNIIFERIASTPGYNSTQKETLKLNTDEAKTIKYFGNIFADTLLLDLDIALNKTDWENSPQFYLYPIHFETLGMRIATACRFIKLNNINAGEGYHISVNDITAFDKYTILYQKYNDLREKMYVKYEPYEFTYFTVDASNNVDTNISYINYAPSYKLNEKYTVNIDRPVISGGNVIFYSAYPLNTGICSIFNIKDFDFDVLDTTNNIQYRTSEVIGTPGEYSKQSVFGNTILGKDEEDIKDYLDKYQICYDTSNGSPIISDLDSSVVRNTFFYNLVKHNHTKSDISVIAPYCCKWKANGTDARGENMRIMYGFNDLISTDSYYIPYISDSSSYTYNKDLGYELNPSVQFDKYIKQSINDIVLNSTDVSTGTFNKKYIIYDNGHIDDILYNVNSFICKESTVYPAGNNTIEFISGGIKFRISSSNDDILNFNTYTGFTAAFIAVNDINIDHATATELIIDEVNKQILFIWYQSYGSLVDTDPYTYRLFHTSSVNDCRCVYNNDSSLVLLTPMDNDTSTDLNSTAQMFMISSKFSGNNKSYTNFANIVIQSDVDASTVYNTPNVYTTENPYIFYDSSYQSANDTLISKYSSNYYNTNELFLADKNSVSGLTNKVRTYDDLLSDINNCGVFVKKNSGGKDYTNLSNILSISIIPSFLCTRRNNLYKPVTSGYVHSCYVQPVMKDMFSFDYHVDTSVCDMFERNFNGSNININDIKPINQLWINKCTSETNYCIPSGSAYYRTSLDLRHNVSLLNDCWSSNMYRKYYIDSDNNEQYNNIYGYMSGYETNMFLNSRGLNLNSYEGNRLIVSKWRNSKTSIRDNYIKINISDSIIYHILFTEGYVKNWKDLNINNNTYRINYIKNYIMTFINIDNYNKFTVYSNPSNPGLTLDDLPEDTSKLTELTNCKHEMTYEDGKYYMYIYPTDKCAHYAKLDISFNG